MEQNRNSMTNTLALVKRTIIQAFEALSEKSPIKVKVANDKVVYSYMASIVERLDKLSSTLKDFPKIEFKDTPASINIQTMGKETIARLVAGIDELKGVMRANRIDFPSVQRVTGSIRVENPSVFPVERLIIGLKSVEESIRRIKLELPPQKEMKMIEMPKSLSMNEGKDILTALKSLEEEIKKLPKSYPKVDFPKTINTNVVSAPPQKYPLPPTHININPLQGYMKSTAITVATSPVALPTTALGYRRSLLIYNNSSSVTLFIGGSDVTTSNGTPVPPLSYGPSLDAGGKLIVYGVCSSSVDVRVLELSTDEYTRGTPNI